MASAKRRCLVEVDKPGILVVMEDMLDQVMVVETLSSGCYCGTG